MMKIVSRTLRFCFLLIHAVSTCNSLSELPAGALQIHIPPLGNGWYENRITSMCLYAQMLSRSPK